MSVFMFVYHLQVYTLIQLDEVINLLLETFAFSLYKHSLI